MCKELKKISNGKYMFRCQYCLDEFIGGNSNKRKIRCYCISCVNKARRIEISSIKFVCKMVGELPDVVSKSGKKERYARFSCNKCKEFFDQNVRSKNVLSGKGFCSVCNHSKGTRMTSHRLSGVWYGIWQRCYDSKRKDYGRYGGIGVTMYDEWIDNPSAFIEWCENNGWKEGLHVDKDIKCSELEISPAIYAPHTISFVTPSENVRESYRVNENIIMFNVETMELISRYSLPVEAIEDNINKITSLSQQIMHSRINKDKVITHARRNKLIFNNKEIDFRYETIYENLKKQRLASQK